MIRLLTGVAIGVMLVVPQTRDQAVHIVQSIWILVSTITQNLIGAF